MGLWTGLVVGLLGGWLIELVIDWLYWRRRSAAETAALVEHNKQHSEAQITSLKASLALAHANNEQLGVGLATATGSAQQHRTVVHTLQAQLNKIGIENKQLQNELSTAQASAHQFQAYASSLRPKPAAPQLPHATSDRIQVGTIFDRDRLIVLPESFSAAPTKPTASQCDPLTDINGIGPAYAQMLFDAGIWTFDDLAHLSPERVQTIIHLQPWQTIDTESWIAEAIQRTRPL